MDSIVSIRTWRNEIVVARDHPQPERVRADVDLMTAQVGDALAAGLADYVDRKGGEVILVRRIVFDCDLDTRCDVRRAAHVLARRCATALVQTIESGSSDVVRFASQAAFVARFVEDVATGNAWGQWYYASFAGVAVLPPSAAIRTVLTDDPELGRDALKVVAPGAWAHIARALEARDATRIAEALGDEDDPTDAHGGVDWIAIATAASGLELAAPVAVLALVVFSQALRLGAPAGGASLAAARLLAALIDLHRRGADDSAAGALTQGDVRGLARYEPALAVALARPLADGEALRGLAGAASGALQRAGAGDERRAAGVEQPAPFGGLVLLLDEIDVLLNREFVAALPDTKGAPARGAAALFVLALAAGPGRAPLVWRDASWRDFFAIDASFGLTDFVDALNRSGLDTAIEARQALGTAARRHVRGAVVATAFRAAGARLHCEVDTATGLWIDLRSTARDEDAEERASPCDDADGQTAPRAQKSFVERLAAARKARRDWHDLDDEELCRDVPLGWRIVLVAAAQIAWRRVAYRVAGMNGASLPYLRRNLLSPHGDFVRSAADRVHWRLARPPLHVLLGLAGLARGTRRWSAPSEQAYEWRME